MEKVISVDLVDGNFIHFAIQFLQFTLPINNLLKFLFPYLDKTQEDTQ